jgi:hypothetical protein
MGKYAQDTQVSIDKSRLEIERTLAKYGASSFMYGMNKDKAIIAFEAHSRRVKFELPMPDREDYRTTETGRYRFEDRTIDAAWEQGKKQRWRALALVIKAKLEAVEIGIVEFEDEFLAHIMLPNGQTMGELARPQLQIAYERGEVPPLLGYDGNG